jgi:hypothetical protein
MSVHHRFHGGSEDTGEEVAVVASLPGDTYHTECNSIFIYPRFGCGKKAIEALLCTVSRSLAAFAEQCKTSELSEGRFNE